MSLHFVDVQNTTTNRELISGKTGRLPAPTIHHILKSITPVIYYLKVAPAKFPWIHDSKPGHQDNWQDGSHSHGQALSHPV